MCFSFLYCRLLQNARIPNTNKMKMNTTHPDTTSPAIVPPATVAGARVGVISTSSTLDIEESRVIDRIPESNAPDGKIVERDDRKVMVSAFPWINSESFGERVVL